MNELFCPHCGSKNIKKNYGSYNEASAFAACLNIGISLIFWLDYMIIGTIFFILAFAASFGAIMDIINGKRTLKNVLNGYNKYTCKGCGNEFTINIDEKKI